MRTFQGDREGKWGGGELLNCHLCVFFLQDPYYLSVNLEIASAVVVPHGVGRTSHRTSM